ncbi:hypothetical protein BD770DRAFT_313990, partial [Pilaira anomala]
YQHYKDNKREQFLDLVVNKGMSARAATIKLNIKSRIAQIWVKKKEKDPHPNFKMKRRQRPPKLGPKHEMFLVDLVDDRPSLVLDQLMDDLTSRFTDLSISKTRLYNFVTDKCTSRF